MSLHIAASGAKQGQWVTCTAGIQCRNDNKNPGSFHIESGELYRTNFWKKEETQKTSYLKNITLDDVKNFRNLSEEERTKFDERYKADNKKKQEEYDARQLKKRKAQLPRKKFVPNTSANARPNPPKTTQANQDNLLVKQLNDWENKPYGLTGDKRKLNYIKGTEVFNVEVDEYKYTSKEKETLGKLYVFLDRINNFKRISAKDISIQNTFSQFYESNKDIIEKYHTKEEIFESFKPLGIYDNNPLENTFSEYSQDLESDLALGSYRKVADRSNNHKINNISKEPADNTYVPPIEKIAKRITNIFRRNK